MDLLVDLDEKVLAVSRLMVGRILDVAYLAERSSCKAEQGVNVLNQVVELHARI